MGASLSGCTSTTTRGGKYDVFLSFRDEDTRDNFKSHLCHALCNKNIDLFVDDRLKRGDTVSPALLEAIEESKISVVIFSKGYASSKWCLDELVKILECKKMHGQIVIPVFYHVNPSDVRKQTGSFEDAFRKHEKDFQGDGSWKLKEQIWRAALTEASNLSGWDSSVTRPDSRLVEEIVKDISKKLNNISSSSYCQGLIGLESRTEQVQSLLCLGMSDFRIIGIWGMGGIGKTTIADVVYNQISSQFEGSCFIANVKQESEKSGGLVRLRDEVLSKILDEENLKLQSPSIPMFIKDRLNRKKVFIVLDDANNFRHLEILAGGLDRFGPGSRIIITTKDKQVLHNFGVNNDSIYEVEGFNHKEALQLFSNYAFRQNYPLEDLLELSNKVVHHAQGNPLAIKVLGSSLYLKSKQEWESALDKLQRIFNYEIHEVLRISYEGLDDEEKDIFLDIACFFNGKDRDYVAKILGDCYFSLSVLFNKSLIIVSDNEIKMHDLIQEMGWEIVRQENYKKPGHRSRLWNYEEVSSILVNEIGTDAVQGIFLDMSKITNLKLTSQTFMKMRNLKLLKFYDQIDEPKSGILDCIVSFRDSLYTPKVHLPSGLNYLSDNLRSLEWHGYPLTELPSNFSPKSLVELKLPYSNLESLWEGTKHAPKLRWLILCHSHRLARIPDFSATPCLEIINLEYCRHLLDIRSSVQHLNNLRFLLLRGCENLRTFPSNIHFKSLISLNLSDCIKLAKFPQISGKLEGLYLNRTAIEEVPSSIESLSELVELHLSRCLRLKHISTSICKLKSLYRLDLRDCSKLESFPEILERMEYLEDINLSGTAIKELPSSIEHLNGLVKLSLNSCKNLETLPSSICNLRSLNELKISNCSKLDRLPEDLGNLKALVYLLAKRAAVIQLPSSLTGLEDLEILDCSGCRGLIIPSLSGSLFSLKELYLNDCNLTKIPEDIGCLSSLEVLELCGNDFESLPKSIKQLSKLAALKLNDCNMLQMLTVLPSSLYYLQAMNCKQLQSLPGASEFAELVTDRCFNSYLRFIRVVLIFTNCMKLNQNTFNEVLAELQRIIQCMERASMFCYEKEHQVVDVGVRICFPGSEIPKWFTYRSCGSSVDIQLPLHNFSNSKLMGFALCAVIACEGYWDLEVHYKFHFETNDGNRVGFTGSLVVSAFQGNNHTILVDSDHIVLGYQFCSDVKLLTGDYKSGSLEFYPQGGLKEPVKSFTVKSCGVCPIYAEKFGAINQDIGKTSQNRSGRSDDEEDEMEPYPKRIRKEANPCF